MLRKVGEVRSTAHSGSGLVPAPKRKISFSTSAKATRNPNPISNVFLAVPESHTATSHLALAIAARNDAMRAVGENSAVDGPLRELQLAVFKLVFDRVLPETVRPYVRIADDFNDLLDVLEDNTPLIQNSRLRETTIDLCYKLIDHKSKTWADDQQKHDVLEALWSHSAEYKVLIPKIVEVEITDSIDRQVLHPCPYIEKQQPSRRLRKNYTAKFPFLPQNAPVADLQIATYQLVEDGILRQSATPEIDAAESIDHILDVLEYHVETLPIQVGRPGEEEEDDDDEEEKDDDDDADDYEEEDDDGQADPPPSPFADAPDSQGGGGGGSKGKGAPGGGGVKLPAESPLYNITADCANDLIDLKSAKRYASAYQRKNVQRSLAAGMGLDPDNVINHDMDVIYEQTVRVDFDAFVPGQDNFL
ncbi:UNVERIFIED_CONTAM: hypothetical protein HDU68_003719 [Siphonaria sp. JEL0065]|nr:hypothetical protein HDU68_003719 [Siphonaria sp. JEL0065]